MAIMKQLFKRKQKKNSVATTDEISVEYLQQLIPIRNLSEDVLQGFALENKAEVYAQGTTLFKAGEQSTSTLYLLRGQVSLSDEQNRGYEVSSDTAKAKFPLASGARYTTTALAQSEVSILRVSPKIMAMGTDISDQLPPLDLPKSLAEQRLLEAFSQHYLNDELEVPSMPGIAVELRKAMQQDIGIQQAVEIIQMDPVIAAKLIQVANCPLYLTLHPAKSCFEAVNRIGLKATRNLVISLSIKQIFNSSNALIKKYMEKLWKQSVYISSICYVLATLNKQVNAEEALLAGLIADIGVVPFLNFAANMPEDYYTEADLLAAMPYIKGPVGVNVLRKWDFPEELIHIPMLADDWFQNSGLKLNITDIVVLARLHSHIGKSAMAKLPAITSIPAASKLENTMLSPENSLQILHDAKHKIQEALNTFSL